MRRSLRSSFEVLYKKTSLLLINELISKDLTQSLFQSEKHRNIRRCHVGNACNFQALVQVYR